MDSPDPKVQATIDTINEMRRDDYTDIVNDASQDHDPEQAHDPVGIAAQGNEDDEIQTTIDTINNMSRLEMAQLWRFAPSGHPYFDTTRPYYAVFKKRFDELGGFSPEISKAIGL